ncbi:MAG: protein translocase subunit SecD [bacterium]
MERKQGRRRWNLHATILAIVVVFVLTASAAFPGMWNSAMDKIGFGPHFSDEGFRLGLDLQGGAHLLYEADMSNIDADDRASALEGVRDVIERRVNAFGVAEPLVQTTITDGHYRLIIELAGVFDISEAIAEIGETPILEFKIPTNLDEVEATEEQEAQVEAAQAEEYTAALAVLDRALAGEDFGALAAEFSTATSTNNNGGYIGFVDSENYIFDELVEQIGSENIPTGVINGIYEAESELHIVNYISEQDRIEVEASHILICHSESDGCDSERSKIEAQLIAEEIQREVTAATFGETAVEKSEGPSAQDEGSLGWVREGMMVEDFETALFAMEDNTISDVVETRFGYHIIYRTNSRAVPTYEIAHIKMDWTTVSDLMEDAMWENTGLSGKHVQGSAVAFDQSTGAPYVTLDFNDEGGDLFQILTEEQIGEVIGIFLDGDPISAPVVQNVIYGGDATITGSFTLEEAKLLAQRLNAGALPVPVDLLSQQTVGPSLGAVSLERSINAALIGFALVALFMIAYYRLAGLLAVLALVVYGAVNLALYKWLGVTLTLAGIAGFILSLGMAVDANVLIFERLKEELISGRDLSTAIDEGFRRAWTSIRDGNITTLIAAAVLFTMSTSFIKGFALTLALGILVSMLTAILVTRVLLHWVSGGKILKSKWLYGGSKSKSRQYSVVSKYMKNFNVIGKTKIWLGISTVLLVAAIASIAIFGLNLGIDFTGGSLMEITMETSAASGEIRIALAEIGFDAVVQDSGESEMLIRFAPLTTEEHDAVIAGLGERYGEIEELRYDAVGPVIGEELKKKSVSAVVLLLVLIVLYVAWAFRKVTKPIASWKYGILTIVAAVHDVIIPLGLFAALGYFYGFQIDTAFVAAMLTILGYSINDTIVVFDRTRENLISNRHSDASFGQIVNQSVMQSFARSINTSLTTLLVLLAIFLFGGETTREFILALMVGIVSGAYSSIFIASPLLVAWEKRRHR